MQLSQDKMFNHKKQKNESVEQKTNTKMVDITQLEDQGCYFELKKRNTRKNIYSLERAHFEE